MSDDEDPRNKVIGNAQEEEEERESWVGLGVPAQEDFS